MIRPLISGPNQLIPVDYVGVGTAEAWSGLKQVLYQAIKFLSYIELSRWTGIQRIVYPRKKK